MSLVLTPEPGPVLVNKGDLAGILGVTVATVSAWVSKRPDFPVFERGTQGREWRFDPAAVVAFVAAMREAARAAGVAQLGLALTDPGDASAVGGFSLAEVKTARQADQVRAERSFLVETSALAGALADALAKWDRRIAELLAAACQDLGLTDKAMRQIAEGLAASRARFESDVSVDALRGLDHQISGG